MLEFKPLGKNVLELKGYPERSEISFCDISMGVKYMWRDDFKIDYAIIEDTLIMKETCRDYSNAFYYPIGKNPQKALALIEEYCVREGVPLKFCCIDNEVAGQLSLRYQTEIYNDRDWSDYIYLAESFKTYSGKKMSGQRNHVNRFKKKYPEYKFSVFTNRDLPALKEFLIEFEHNAHFSGWSAIEEQKKVLDYVEHAIELNQLGGFISVNDKIIAISFGEIVNDTLIVHVEKGIYSYEGVYPTMAQEFAKAFATEKVKYINREEDCGDMGLRVSKLQYHPIEVKQKNLVRVKTFADKINLPIKINTERLEIESTGNNEEESYFKLSVSDEINKLWGYDYREDLGENAPNQQYFANFRKALEDNKEEFSLAVKLNGQMIGEIVLWNFAFDGGVEVGTRFFSEYHGKGYAYESVGAVINYLKNLGVKTLRTRAFFENFASNKLFQKLGFEINAKDDRKNYYVMKN